jgi:hypothetical protein
MNVLERLKMLRERGTLCVPPHWLEETLNRIESDLQRLDKAEKASRALAVIAPRIQNQLDLAASQSSGPYGLELANRATTFESVVSLLSKLLVEEPERRDREQSVLAHSEARQSRLDKASHSTADSTPTSTANRGRGS